MTHLSVNSGACLASRPIIPVKMGSWGQKYGGNEFKFTLTYIKRKAAHVHCSACQEASAHTEFMLFHPYFPINFQAPPFSILEPSLSVSVPALPSDACSIMDDYESGQREFFPAFWNFLAPETSISLLGLLFQHFEHLNACICARVNSSAE